MKKQIFFIVIFTILIILITSCRKENVRNIILDKDYRLQKFTYVDQNGNITDLLNSIFPGVADQIVIRFKKDGNGSISADNQSDYIFNNNVVVINNYQYGNWWSSNYYNNYSTARPVSYGFTWYYLDRRDGIGMNYNIDQQYYNTDFGRLLIGLSGEYSIRRISGLRIGPNETIRISNGVFELIIKK